MPRKLLVGGAQRSGSLRGLTVKKVAPPTVPALPSQAANHKRSSSISNNPCVCNGDQLGEVTPDYEDERYSGHGYRKPAYPPPDASGRCGPSYNCEQQYMENFSKNAPGAGSNGQIHYAHVIVHSQPESLPTTPVEPLPVPNLIKGRLMSGTQASLEDQGIDVMSSPGRHSPGGSSGGSSISRHSLSSLDSGRASAPGSDGKATNRRLSVHSYGDGCSAGSPQRRSYHSSSSSLASSDDPNGPAALGPNVAEMVLHGLPDVEVLRSWLASLHFEEYTSLFLQAGYDMPTITRMTPEDLTAVGITKPNHRRKLKSEIAKLNISDGIPEYKPDTLLEWLQLLRLEEYYETLCHEHYDTIDRVTELTWEDLEDIGIQKLGHQKKILLAIKRIEDINHGRRPNLVPPSKVMQNIAEHQVNSSTSCTRPSTLSSVNPYAYPPQEIAIAMHRPKNSPSTDSIPEMKTFQQSPVKEETLAPLSRADPAAYYQNGNVNPVLSPCRGRSLESLQTEDAPQQPPNIYPAESNPVVEKPKVQNTKDWKTTDLDTDHSYECEGTATLNRPKGMVKLRPVAKITAKTREEIAEIIMDIPNKEFKSLISQNRTLDGWSSLDGSPRHGPSTVPRASTLRRPPPPPPPKRSNSTKGEHSAPEARKEETAVRQKTIQAANAPTRVPVQELKKTEEASQLDSEEFPPPPSPLPSASEGETGKGQMEELFSNPLFRQKRKDSAESSSSIDSAALPFANEAVGTIKQKASRPYPNLLQEASQRYADKDRNSVRNSSGSNDDHEYDQTPELMSPGDVIDDIEHMLANLSDQLDAMLDEEQIQK